MAWNRSTGHRQRVRTTLAAILAAALVAPAAGAAGTPKPAAPRRTAPAKAAPVTDANVARRVLSARTRADNEALAAYYKAKAAAEDPRIEFYDQLFHAYMKLEGKKVEPLQRHARALLRAARVSKARYEELAKAHQDIAWED
jgi:hypothetical protein